jgi:hypothetical protein
MRRLLYLLPGLLLGLPGLLLGLQLVFLLGLLLGLRLGRQLCGCRSSDSPEHDYVAGRAWRPSY